MFRYRINQIKLGLGEDISSLPEKIKKKSRDLRNANITDVTIVKRSLDARETHVKQVFTVDFSCDKKCNLPEPPDVSYVIPKVNAPLSEEEENTWKKAGHTDRPVIIGFGPCGMFAALVLAKAGLSPIVIERGLDVDKRIKIVQAFWETGKLDPECNVQFGEGGAGTFSDGKLNTGIKDPRINFVLKTFAEAGADSNILIDARPHIGTDDLRKVVKNIREEIKSLGGEIKFGHKLTEAGHSDDGFVLTIKNESETYTLSCHNLVLAIGHSSRDTYRMLRSKKIHMEPKPFSMGVRVEHDQRLIDQAMYGEDAGHPNLPPAYYKLATRVSDGRGVYSFCMCPGGEIVNASSQEGMLVTNGMSNHDRDSGKANSGILVDVRPQDFERPDDPMAGIEMQEKYEHLAFINGGGTYNIPTTTWGEYSQRSASAAAVISSLPDFVARDIAEAMPIFGRKIKGFDNDDTIIKAIESRSSAPLRIIRNKGTLEGYEENSSSDLVPIPGFYPAGEGAGYAGGITSAACDGIKIAERIIEKYLY